LTHNFDAHKLARPRAKNGQRRKGFRLMSNPVSQLAKAALDTLHGARGLPPAEAVAKLHDFLESIDTSVPDSPRFAASEALRTLVSQLETEGTATDDDWQRAIETMLSLANEAG
jgi:hypothetical protein